MNLVVFKLCVAWSSVVFAVLVSRSSCAPIQNYDNLDEWLRRNSLKPWTFPTWEPWTFPTREPWTFPTGRPTILPFTWNPWTPPTFRPRTIAPWKPITWSPPGDNYDYIRSGDDTATKLLIFIPLTAAAAIVAICKYYCKQNNCCDDSEHESRPTLHSPPRSSTTNPPPRSSTTVPLPRSSTTVSPVRSSTTVPSFPLALPVFPTRGSQYEGIHYTPTINAAGVATSDKPPDYSTVVLDDMTQQQAKFPEVKLVPKMDTPPPQYDEKKWQKF